MNKLTDQISETTTYIKDRLDEAEHWFIDAVENEDESSIVKSESYLNSALRSLYSLETMMMKHKHFSNKKRQATRHANISPSDGRKVLLQAVAALDLSESRNAGQING